MTKNIVAARANTTAKEIGTKLLIGNFNGLPIGTAINVCTKINSKAPANKMVIGDDLYHIVKYLDDYNFTPIGRFSMSLNQNNDYSIYLVGSKQQENILNPFKRKSSNQ